MAWSPYSIDVSESQSPSGVAETQSSIGVGWPLSTEEYTAEPSASLEYDICGAVACNLAVDEWVGGGACVREATPVPVAASVTVADVAVAVALAATRRAADRAVSTAEVAA